MEGQQIINLYTLGSRYDNNSLSVKTDEGIFRIKAEEILKMVNNFRFKKVKKKVHTYLEVDIIQNKQGEIKCY